MLFQYRRDRDGFSTCVGDAGYIGYRRLRIKVPGMRNRERTKGRPIGLARADMEVVGRKRKDARERRRWK